MTEAVTGAATGESLVAGGVLVAVSGSVVLVCLTATDAMDGRRTPIDVADAFYGTHFGDLQKWIQGCPDPRSTSPANPSARPWEEDQTSPLQTSHGLEPGTEDKRQKRTGRIYVTYTKFNGATRRTYSGRTSMLIDLNGNLETQADLAVAS